MVLEHLRGVPTSRLSARERIIRAQNRIFSDEQIEAAIAAAVALEEGNRALYERTIARIRPRRQAALARVARLIADAGQPVR